MKKVFLSIIIIAAFTNCRAQEKKTNSNEVYSSYGAKINDENTLTNEDLATKYAEMKSGDTINVKFKSKINTVCQNKGCWMKVALADNKETFVKFKDYAFFMPKDSKNKEVVVNGKAFVSEESIADQKHYASDAGKSKAEIDKITTTKKTLSFMADGVLIKN